MWLLEPPALPLCGRHLTIIVSRELPTSSLSRRWPAPRDSTDIANYGQFWVCIRRNCSRSVFAAQQGGSRSVTKRKIHRTPTTSTRSRCPTSARQRTCNRTLLLLAEATLRERPTSVRQGETFESREGAAGRGRRVEGKTGRPRSDDYPQGRNDREDLGRVCGAKKRVGTLTGRWVPHDTRDEVVDTRSALADAGNGVSCWSVCSRTAEPPPS